MKKVDTIIIGAGISGLTYANYSKNEYLIIEKEDRVGGYCKTTYKDDFVWDYAGHFFHFKSDEFKNFFLNSLSEKDFVRQEKKTYIYYKNKLIDYPFQMNIHQLDQKEFIDCLYDLFNKEEKEEYDNFQDMLYGKFGKSITEKFLKPYNEKLYACDLKTLDKDAMGRFFPYADIKSIINNFKEAKNNSYNNSFLYPKKGAQVIIDVLMKNIKKENIMLNTSVKNINIEEKYIELENGEKIYYTKLINTIPFNQFLNLTTKKELKKLSNELTYNKVLVFNLGFNKKSCYEKEHWLYFPEKDINFYRVGFYDNILNEDKLSMYIEIGYPKNANIDKNEMETQLKLTLENLTKIGVIDDSFDLVAYETIIMNPAYVHIDTKNDKNVREIIHDLEDNNIYTVGRYGGWTYCSMEDCMIEAKEIVDK